MLREVTRKEYMYYFNKLQKGKEDIDTSKYSNTYYALDNDAYVGIEYLKKGVVNINGLFSLQKGKGEELLQTLIRRFQTESRSVVVLNCTKALRDNYYKKLNLPVIIHEAWSKSDLDYVELVMFL